MNKNSILNVVALALVIPCFFSYLIAQEQDVQIAMAKRSQLIDQNPKNLIVKTLDQQTNQLKLEVEGEIPQWLNGILLRVGPAQFETKNQQVSHSFDGFSMAYAFDFTSGELTYSNKFLDTAYYKHAMETGEIVPGFATADERNIFQRAWSFLTNLIFGNGKIPYDNANVNIAKIADHYVALTETPFVVEIDGKTIQTRGLLEFDDQLIGDVTTAHPLIDPNTGEMFNYLTQYGSTSYYHVYKIEPGNTQRKILASIPVDNPSYMHSFALSKDYLILSQVPLTVNPFTLLMSSKAFIDNLVWEPEKGTTFTVVDRHNGTIIGNLKTEAFFTFHHINAYQKDSSIIVDLVAYDDDTVLHAMSIDGILEQGLQEPSLRLLRFTLDVMTKKVSSKKLSQTSLEMPRINYEHNGTREYRYVYGIGSGAQSERYGSSVAKVNVQTGDSIAWINDDCTVGEPVFVAHPRGISEDDGVILAVVLDHAQKKSFLLVLDAKTLIELARAYIPHHIPFGFHGNFFDR